MAKGKFFTKEVKIGISFVVAFALLYWGINFLKGINLFTPTNHYILKYERIDGLVVSNGVFVKGYKIGQVHNIKYDFSKPEPFSVTININDDVRLPKGTVAALFDESLMGGKGINLLMAENTAFHNAGDTLATTIDAGLMGAVADIIPTLTATVRHADSLVLSIDQLVNSSEIKHSLSNIESLSSKLDHTASSVNRLVNNDLRKIMYQIDTTMNNITVLTSNLSKVDYTDIMYSIDTTMTNVQEFTRRINDPNGTVGLLLNDPALYREITSTVTSANNLLIDLKANPKRYVHFSLFGGKNKEKKENRKQ